MWMFFIYSYVSLAFFSIYLTSIVSEIDQSYMEFHELIGRKQTHLEKGEEEKEEEKVDYLAI